MVRWEATYLGSRVVAVVSCDAAYALLGEHDLVSWQAGGCAILAEALSQVLGAEPYGLVRDDGVVDHVVAKVEGGYYLDADGAYTSVEMREKHEELEGHRVTLKRLSASVALEGISCPVGAVDALVELLEEGGVG